MSIGYIKLWTKGMTAIANNTEDFTDINSHIVQEEYSISINLKDLESNQGKELYNDGKNKILVSAVDNTGMISTGGYRIHFRAYGQYSLNYAELISGVQHFTEDNNSFIRMTAEMTATYKGKVYNSNVMGTSGINYKYGDDFSFYIFPSEAYEDKEVTLDETGEVVLTITNLYKNVWTKK